MPLFRFDGDTIRSGTIYVGHPDDHPRAFTPGYISELAADDPLLSDETMQFTHVDDPREEPDPTTHEELASAIAWLKSWVREYGWLVYAEKRLQMLYDCALDLGFDKELADDFKLGLNQLANFAKEAISATAVDSTDTEQSTEPEPPPEAVWLGSGKFRVGDKTIMLESQQAAVLQALVTLRAASKPELEKESGYADAVAVLKKLRKKFPELEPHILLAGGRGKGGYSTTIKTK